MNQRNANGWAGWALGIFCGLALMAPAVGFADQELKFGVYTSKKPTDMVKQSRPLLNMLEEARSAAMNEKIQIRLEVAKTYEEGIQALVDGTFDFSQVGPVSYVQAKEKSPALEVLAIEGLKGHKTLNGVICVLSNAVIATIHDLAGKKFAFGDEFSTTGRFNSQLYLVENGITSKELAGFKYLERHDRVGAAIAGGDFDAGALNERTFKKMVETGSPLRALAYFPIDGRPWVARAGLDPKIKKALREALLGTKEPKVLASLGEEGLSFLPGKDEDFVLTRKAVKENFRFAP